MLIRSARRLSGLGLILAASALTASSVEPTIALGHRLAPAQAVRPAARAARPGKSGLCTTNGSGGVTPGGSGNVAGGTDSGVLSGGSVSVAPAGPNRACDLDAVIGGGTGNLIFKDRVDSAKAESSFIAAGIGNTIAASLGFVGSGADNVVTGDYGFVGTGGDNTVSGEGSFIGGGGSSSVSGTASFAGAGSNANVSGDDSFVGSGDTNFVTSNYSFVGSGSGNTVGNFSNKKAGQYGAVVGGQGNAASGDYGFVGGGKNNAESAAYGVVAGGNGNVVSGRGAAIPGGSGNLAAGNDSFAAGTRSEAAGDGDFVWSDDAGGAKQLSSAAPNQFLVRSSGGVTFYTDAALATGVTLAAGGGSWASLSDRALKTAISPLDGERMLAKLATLPLSEWSYKSEGGVRHVGPMAQDFFAAFGVGEDDRHITAVDADGVSLAAIQGLYRVERRENAALRKALGLVTRAQNEQRRALAARHADIASLEKRLDALAAEVASLRSASRVR